LTFPESVSIANVLLVVPQYTPHEQFILSMTNHFPIPQKNVKFCKFKILLIIFPVNVYNKDYCQTHSNLSE